MEKQVLAEYMPLQISGGVIRESMKQHDGRILIKGLLQRAEAQNQNGRVYPHPILAREATKYETLIKEKRALGELDHPDSSVVNLSNVSHNIIEMHWEGKDLVGTIEVLNTPPGKILQELLKAGILVGISSRGLGSVQESTEGGAVVQDDFELIAFDMVSNPSTQNAFMKPIHESVDKYGKVCIDKYCRIQEIVTEILIDMGE
jgi:hypothetical protein